MKKRKTREQKKKTQEKANAVLFEVKEEWLGKGKKIARPSVKNRQIGTNFLKADLTKTFVLTMLVLALELALWLYLSKL